MPGFLDLKQVPDRRTKTDAQCNSSHIAAHRSEEADTYAGVLYRIGSRLRVIRCRHGLQCVVQRRRQARDKRAGLRWGALGVCATQAGLLRIAHALSGADGTALAEWAAGQPATFSGLLEVADGC